MNYCRFKDQQHEEWMLLGPPHPAEIFRDEVWPHLEMDRKTLAAHLGVSVSTTSKFMNRRIRVSPRIAAGLASLTGRNALYWLVLQAQHDAWLIQNSPEWNPSAPFRARARRLPVREPA